MKKYLLYLCGLAILTSGIITYKTYTYSNNQCIAGRGCCSRHGGVCGCKNGHSKCCDGTISPTCQCFKDDVKGFEI